jgi:hypothetical protein
MHQIHVGDTSQPSTASQKDNYYRDEAMLTFVHVVVGM